MKDEEKIMKDSTPFKAVDGSYHATMEEVKAFNEAYWQYKNPVMIDKDSELFKAPLSPEIYDRIVASPNYRCLIDILEERLGLKQLDDGESKGMKR